MGLSRGWGRDSVNSQKGVHRHPRIPGTDWKTDRRMYANANYYRILERQRMTIRSPFQVGQYQQRAENRCPARCQEMRAGCRFERCLQGRRKHDARPCDPHDFQLLFTPFQSRKRQGIAYLWFLCTKAIGLSETTFSSDMRK